MDVATTQVTSEIFSQQTATKGQLNAQNVITRFYYTPPCSSTPEKAEKLKTDEDGDLVVPRKKPKCLISIEHSPQSSLDLVGLQVWRGALLLADWVLHQGATLFQDQVVLELGAGTGLTSIVATKFAREVIATDMDAGGLLDLIRANVVANSKVGTGTARVFPLDFRSEAFVPEVEEALKRVTVVLAADVIYDNDLSEYFVKCLTKILNIPPKKTLFFALEKRFVFTISDLDVVAPCYEYFMSLLEKARCSPAASDWSVQEIPTDFPQFFEYERLKQMVLLKISS